MKEKLRKIMKRAWEIKKENRENIFGLCLKMAWAEMKVAKEIVWNWRANFLVIKNWKGEEFRGYWNRKFYDSKIDGHRELSRIYVDSERIHLTEETTEELFRQMNKGAEMGDYTAKKLYQF